jgi:lytic cellulose monooxygenase (C1-hydroxylating)
MSRITKTFLAALTSAATVVAHGHVQNIVINGISYRGYDPTSFPYQKNPPTVVGWSTQQTDNGFIAPSAFGNADMICHKSATNAGGHAVVVAGDSIFIQWNTWPESHHGPVIDYLAACGSTGCESADKSTLEFFKIDGVGLVKGGQGPGFWASDQLIANNNSWLVQIPVGIAPGFYVLRHEIIALHSAGQMDGAQAYPQCFNLQVTGSGTEKPAGVLGTKLYAANDPGILFNLYTSLSSYPIPGPALIPGAKPIEQVKSVITASASAVVGSATAPPTAKPTTTVGSGGNSGGSGPSLGSGASSTSKPAAQTPTTAPATPSTPTTQTTRASAPAATGGGAKPTRKITCPGAKKKHHTRIHARDVQME